MERKDRSAKAPRVLPRPHQAPSNTSTTQYMDSTTSNQMLGQRGRTPCLPEGRSRGQLPLSGPLRELSFPSKAHLRSWGIGARKCQRRREKGNQKGLC